MSRLDELIAEFCPDGVKYVKLKEVAQISAGGDLPKNYAKGQKVPTKQYPYPIYSNGIGSGALYGFADSYKIEKEAVTISARGTIGYHEVRAGKFTPIVRLITMIADESKITTKFLHYAMFVAGIEGVTTGIPSLTVPMLEKFTIPLPPLPVQQEIVRILDNFTELTAELKAEIEARKKQYEYYRDWLLSQEELNKLWPDGMEFVELNEVLDYEQPTKYIVRSTNYDDSYTIPVLTAGQSFVLGYTNENFGIYQATPENPVIIFDDFTTSFHWVDFRFKVKSSAMKMLKPRNKEIANFRFLFHTMRNIDYTPVDHTRQWIEKYSKFKIPLPPLPVQQEIVRILDNFTELTTELEAELEARQKQYEYYRDKLLSFKEVTA